MGLGAAAKGQLRTLWLEYVGPAGDSGLRRREQDRPTWKQGNPASRELFNQKMFVYREIARQTTALGSVSDAIDAVECRFMGVSWKQRLQTLREEQPDGAVRDGLTHSLLSLHTEFTLIA